MSAANLVCVKHGSAYGPEYVTNLYNSAKRRTSCNFVFHILTDNADSIPYNRDWVVHQLPDWNLRPDRAWWYKLVMFDPEIKLQGRNLYTDLDVIITGDLAPLWKHAGSNFTICQDFNRVYDPKFKGLNSSVMAWTNNAAQYLYNDFIVQRNEIIGRHRGDQDFITEKVQNAHLWPREWILSYKWEILKGGIIDRTIGKYRLETDESVIPHDCKIIACHGKPKPHEITDEILKKAWTGT